MIRTKTLKKLSTLCDRLLFVSLDGQESLWTGLGVINVFCEIITTKQHNYFKCAMLHIAADVIQLCNKLFVPFVTRLKLKST